MKSRSTMVVVIGACFVLGWALLAAGSPQPAPDEPALANLQAQLEAVQAIFRHWKFQQDNPFPSPAGRRETWKEMAIREMMRVWSLRLKDAQYALAKNPAEQAAALRGHADRMNEHYKRMQSVERLALGSAVEVAAANYYRLEAEALLAQVRNGP